MTGKGKQQGLSNLAAPLLRHAYLTWYHPPTKGSLQRAASHCSCAAHRLANLLLVPTTEFTLVRLPRDRQLKPSAASFVSALVFGSHLSTEWALSLGLRLGFWRHLALHSLMPVRIMTEKAAAFCWTPYIHVSLLHHSREAAELPLTRLTATH